jgi:hypothetical protein
MSNNHIPRDSVSSGRFPVSGADGDGVKAISQKKCFQLKPWDCSITLFSLFHFNLLFNSVEYYPIIY